MKKVISLLLLLFLVFQLIGCGGNRVSPNNGQIVFSFPDDFKQYLPYEESEIPSYTLTFEGNINTVVGATTSNKKVFSKNDDFVMSDYLENLFNENQSNLTVRLIKEESKKFETKMNSLVLNDKGEYESKTHVLKVKDGIVYNELAYITTNEGLTLTVEYRRFVAILENNTEKTYYSWRYSSPLNAVLHYPLMIVLNENSEKEFLIVPLPTKVVYHLGVSTQVPLSTMLEKDDYMQPNFRTFYYPNYSDDPRELQKNFDREADILEVKSFYTKAPFDGYEKEGNFYFSYLGKDFKVSFDEYSFQIDYITL